jgi:hypothetical protein
VSAAGVIACTPRFSGRPEGVCRAEISDGMKPAVSAGPG